jgi:alanine dehydrogenase
MKVGVPKEIKLAENRVALRPAGAEALAHDGHEVVIERSAGTGSGFSDEDYVRAGARIEDDASKVWADCELILKVKEPQPSEYGFLRPDQALFTYFHFAASEELTRAVLDSGATAIAYETVQEKDGSLPLLIPMSEIAGRMSVQDGAKALERSQGGRGILLGGVPGTPRARVLVLGGGIVGFNAAKIAAGMGAEVTILDLDLPRLRYLDDVLPDNVTTLYSDAHNIREHLAHADLVIGAVLLPGAKAPRLVKRDDLKTMQEGAVIVDVAVDQGGCIETTRPTTHENPTFVVDGIVHYGVTNMPGAVPRTSTIALTNATFPYVRRIASQGWRRACREYSSLCSGLNIVDGHITHSAVAAAFNFKHTPPQMVR